MANIAGGMMEPFVGQTDLKFNVMALLACIGDEDKALLAADEAVQLLESAYTNKDVQDLIGAGILMYAAY
jgi:hypothetical protein